MPQCEMWGTQIFIRRDSPRRQTYTVDSQELGREDQGDAFEHLLEARNFALQMFGPVGRDAVGSHPAVGGRNLPFGIDQAGFQQTLEGWVKRALLDLEQIA